MPLTSHINFRLRGIPLIHEKKTDIRELVKQTLNLNPTTIISVHSVAVSPSDHTSRIATLTFSDIPTCFLDQSTNEWAFHLKDGDDLDLSSSIVFDTHFRGFTPFHRANPEDCDVDIIAVTGLGGHALGSFKQKNGPFVWLRDGLPVDVPNLRILSYGYDTAIINSRSFQNLTDLARSFHLDLRGIQDSNHTRPIVFIAHSLGGLLVKETIVQMTRDSVPSERPVLDLISGFLFFGVPHQGLAVEYLVPMIRDSPNRALLESLGKNSPLLSRLRREFSDALGTKHHQIVSFYETERSLTAQEVQPGKWELNGPSEVLVEVSSANCGSLRQHPINRNHSEMVKYSSRQDDLYQRVLQALRPVLVDSRRLQMSTGTSTGYKPNISLSEDEKSCRRSLAFQEQDHRYAELCYDRNTCKWLLGDSQFQAWLNGPRGLFWIKGSPGTGKSVLMKFAVETMQSRRATGFVASFFIHGRGVPLQRTPLGLFRALLSSLFEYFPISLQDLTQRFKHYEERFGHYERKGGWAWTDTELEILLSKVLVQGTKANPVTIYVDALDECGEEDAKRLLQYFDRIMRLVDDETGLLKICFSSRHYPILGLETMPTILVEEKNGKDIRLVVQNRLKQLNLRERRQQIENDILMKAQGGFQWAILVTDIIQKGALRRLNSATLLQTVTTIPEKLQDLYEALLIGAEGEERAQMVKLFRWVLFSERPLSAHELREALTASKDMEFTKVSQLRDHPNHSDTVSDFEIRVRYISRGLVEFQSREVWEIYQTDGEDWDREAQFVHQSAADFVQQKFLANVDFGPGDHSVGGMAHFEISRSCLKYIFLEDILGSNQLSRRELSVKFPLLPYAVTFLLRHINRVEQSGITQTDLLELVQWYQPDRLRMLSALWLKMDPDHSHAPMGWPFVGASAPHILVGLGSLSALRTYLIHHTINFNARDSYGNTPLLLALRDGLEDLALLLLDQSVTLQARKKSLVQDDLHAEQLGEEADCLSHLNTTNKDGETPLGVAVSTKAHEAIQFMLRAGADLKMETGLLFYAIGTVNKPLLSYLMERKVCLDGAVFFTVQTLHGSSQSDHKSDVYDILSTLLDAGANTHRVPGVMEEFNPEYAFEEDDEAIIVASRHGLTSALKLLVLHPALTSDDARRSLQVVGLGTDEDPFDVLLQETLDVLSKAYLESGLVTQREIENHVVDVINSDDVEIARHLFWAFFAEGVPSDIMLCCIANNQYDLVEFIFDMEGGIKAIRDDWPDFALQTALELEVESYEMVDLLLMMCDINPSTVGKNGRTPLRQCLSEGRRDMVSLMLNKGRVDIHKNDNDDESPFWWTMRNGDNSVVQLLLGLNRSNIHRIWAGRTAFWWLTEGRPYERGRVAIANAALNGRLFNCKKV